MAGVDGQVVGKRSPLNVPLISVTEIEVDMPSTGYVSGMLENRMSSPKPAGSLAGRTTTSAGVPSGWYVPEVGSLTDTASPARSDGPGGLTSVNSAGRLREIGSRMFSVAVTVPVPTTHAACGALLFRQAPWSIDALAITPAGSWSARFLTESPPLGLNLISVPRFPVEAAVTVLGLSFSVGLPIAADAAGASAAVPASATAVTIALRHHPCPAMGSLPPVRAAQHGSRARRRRAQEFLMTMPSMMFAARSVASIAASRRSNRSFQRITTIGSIPPSNREATASRVIRSPSFSSRLTSTV